MLGEGPVDLRKFLWFILRLMEVEKVGLKFRMNPAGMCRLSAEITVLVKCFVAESIDVWCVMSKCCM